MKTKKLVLKTLTLLLVIFAFTFSTNANALGNSNQDYTTEARKKKKKKKKKKKCGKCGQGQCGGHNGSVPLDGGLSILLLGAAAFGVKKLRKNDTV